MARVGILITQVFFIVVVLVATSIVYNVFIR